MNSEEPKITENHDTIKNWVEERYGEPALVEGVIDKGKAGEMLRIDFPSHSEKGLKSISWELFFEIFEENNLAFLYHENTLNGDENKYYELINKK